MKVLQQRGGPGSDNSAFRMTLAGRMPLTIVHASSASALAQRPVKYLLFDEVSRFPVSARGRAQEGDPVALGRIRQTTYGDSAKTIYVSSPVEEHQCRITELYEDRAGSGIIPGVHCADICRFCSWPTWISRARPADVSLAVRCGIRMRGRQRKVNG